MVCGGGSQTIEMPVFTLKFQWFRGRTSNALDALAEHEIL
jgi:hypothetical protein